MKRFFKQTAATAAAIAVLCASTLVQADEKKDIVDTAVAAGSFKTLAAAVLVEALKGKGPFTVFAPTDEAFAKLPAGTVETLLKPENKDQLTAVLTYHVVAGQLPAKQVVDLKGAKTLNGQRVDIAVAGGKVTVDKANVVKTDIHCSNGIVHVIDSVILPGSDNIVVTADKAGAFKTLIAAAQAAGLAEALTGKGPFTVFAPTDEAFAKLPEGTVATLLKPENKAKLAAILKYHVVSGRVYSEDALAAKKAKTLQGSDIHISVSGGKVKINDANLVTTDLLETVEHELELANSYMNIGLVLREMRAVELIELTEELRDFLRDKSSNELRSPHDFFELANEAKKTARDPAVAARPRSAQCRPTGTLAQGL